MTTLPVVVMTCDKYLRTLQGFLHLYDKYWKPHSPLVIGGYSAPGFGLPDYASFHTIGDQLRYPLAHWSDGLIDLLEQRPDLEFFTLMLEDYWLTRPVQTDAVCILADYIRQFRYVLKIDLMTDRLYAAGMSDYDTVNYLDLIRSDHNSQYHMSLMTGIWNRELLLSFLVRGETPWDVELRGTPRVARAQDQVLVLGTRQAPVRHILAHRAGDGTVYHLVGLKPHDQEELRKLGVLP